VTTVLERKQQMNDEKFPLRISKSVAPFGYSMHADRTVNTDSNVTYRCTGMIVTIAEDRQRAKREYCPFQVSIDPRDMAVDTACTLFSQHWDQQEHE